MYGIEGEKYMCVREDRMYERERQYVLHAYSDVVDICREKPCVCGLFARKSPVGGFAKRAIYEQK